MTDRLASRPSPRRRSVRRAASRAAFALLAAVLVALASPGPFARPALAAGDGTFQTTANPGGGTILTGTLGSASLPDATAALMRRVHAQLGARPAILDVARNASDRSVALTFSASRNGTPYAGLALVAATAGASAGVAALYDTSARFRTTVGPMMRRLNAMTNAAPAAAVGPVAPPEKLITHAFADGTGSIGLPADWTLTVGGGGSASATGPTGEVVAYNMHWSALDMTNPRAQFFMRSEAPQMREQFMHRVALLPYTGDPVKAWLTMFDQLAKQNGTFQPHFQVASATSAGPQAADITGTGSGNKPIHFIAHVFLLPPNPNGMWSMSNSFIFLPDAEIGRQGATANAVLNSVRINFGAVAQQGAAIREVFQKKFDTMLATARAQTSARTERVNQAMATDRAAQEQMHKQAVAMEHYSLDRAVVVNTATGAHSTIGSGFADALVKDNPRYQKVPAKDLLPGVDY